MQDLILQEQFEIEVLDILNSGRFLNKLIFLGGTMLRLCFGMNRFSVDLDFWLVQGVNASELFKSLKAYLKQFYELKDSALKFYTLLFELKNKNYPRSLKIEIRKEPEKIKTEQAIAYSKYSSKQVLVNIVSLEDMMRAKIDALLDRKEIRDAFDIEFLYRRGIGLNGDSKKLKKVLKVIDSFSRKDYSVKLASLLEDKERKYYLEDNFKILKLAIKSMIGNSGKPLATS